MENTIDIFFFFLCRQIEFLRNITLTKKASYFVAPLLPLSAVILNIELMINVNWLFIFLLFISLIFTFILGRSSFYFLRGKNIFLINQVAQILRLSIKNYQSNDELLPLFFTRNSIEIKLKAEIEIKEVIEIKAVIEKVKNAESDIISFCETQLRIITQAFNSLNKEIISDDTSLNDFINVIKCIASKGKNNNESIIKLQTPSDNCAYFLQSFFIPFVELITRKRVTLLSTHKYFLFSISNEYRTLNYDSITKNSRKISTLSQRNIYNQILESNK